MDFVAAHPDMTLTTTNPGSPNLSLPSVDVRDWFVRLLGLFSPVVATATKGLGINSALDGSHGPPVMGFQYVPVSDSALASAAFLAERERTKVRSSRRGLLVIVPLE